MDKQDLSIVVDDAVLNVRVVVLLKSEQGYLFEESDEGYLFPLGGRVKIHESTIEACAREILEETNLKDIDVKLFGVLENFFINKEEKQYHELNFVFKADLQHSLDVDSLVSESNVGFVYVKPEETDQYDIRPRPISDVLSMDDDFFHIVNRE